MDSTNFQITILEHSWLPGSTAEEDLCSHGRIGLFIGGQQITSGKEDLGVSESALALLRTLHHDHSAAKPVAQMLIFHGCGTMLMMGCPIGVDWDVRHVGDRVSLSKVVRFDGTGEGDARRFPNLTVDLSETEYRDRVLAFAREAKEPLPGSQRHSPMTLIDNSMMTSGVNMTRYLVRAVEQIVGRERRGRVS